mmetsp:Transcript_26317/g.37714  ORF Transcript_26317/g.37714 Transcript_26317/m.37714 type:complete len:113 (-) Transcript_26317:310-648(-)|eukprot:CAMPEP_0172432880 /NCGR_PEP_ID=MMETSP1064-20121228/65343_1 /TAXON_ID=202472 /ORGANISM="Aulacoseira subarctica , Strain CCAP 1002/5" /LENGTH=112 /DNA_ID=CAMNT_0013180467 /DNA_START=124 /DNA_END=462 /DNA_ORIENTATION=+
MSLLSICFSRFSCVRNNLITNSNHSVRHFSKFLSRSKAKFIPLTTKRAKKGFYKGKGCTNEGHLTSKGRFVVDWSKRLQLIVPDLAEFNLKPYIAKTVSKFPPETRRSGPRV